MATVTSTRRAPVPYRGPGKDQGFKKAHHDSTPYSGALEICTSVGRKVHRYRIFSSTMTPCTVCTDVPGICAARACACACACACARACAWA
eukprot:scaffold52866_cov71-Phaeocystis_antarctica.AAC.2